MSGTGPEYLAENRSYWESVHEIQDAVARRQWAATEPTWGVFGIPESVAKLLPDRFDGARTIELGCGTGYVSAWMARRGAVAFAIDPTTSQIRIARQNQIEFGLDFPLVQAAGEQVPFRDESFDFAISEYGAAIWADPYKWIPEASRLLRPGSPLVVLKNSVLLMLCVPDEDGVPATERLLREQFGMHRFQWPDEPGVEFHLSHGDWIKLFRANRFEIEDLVELRPPAGLTTEYEFVTLDWARKWPCEEVWVVRKSVASS
jgi:SAM-dependent methyltransferase